MAFTPKRLIQEINVVPYIDVMLVLLVIFMATAPAINQGVEVTLPKSQAKTLALKNTVPVVITVSQNSDPSVLVSWAIAINDPENEWDVKIKYETFLEARKQKNQS